MDKKKSMLMLNCLLVVVLVLGFVGIAYAKTDNNQLDARKIVVFKDALVNDAEKDKILEQYGAKKIKHLPLINASVVIINSSDEKALEKNASILRIDPDVLLYAQVKSRPVTPAPEVKPWGVDRIDADLAWVNNKGSKVKVAVLDTGIDLDHPDLKDNLKAGVNTINPFKSADDDNGHGTHVAGIIAAIDNEIGVIGVAPMASLYPVKVLDRSGSGYLSDIIEGLTWCIDNGMQVANMSFGTTTDLVSLHDAITAASENIVLVAAAGNSGPGDSSTVLYPAKYSEVIAVSATGSDEYNTIPEWSSRGSEVDLAAPGVSINSTYKGGGYKILSGTSMAAPHVAGTAALIIKPGITTSADVRDILQKTADDMGAEGKDTLYGYWLVDAEEAATGIQTIP